jgi:hypothetical protein
MHCFCGKNLFKKWFPSRNSFPEKCFEFSTFFAPDSDMVVRPQQAWLEFAIRGYPEPVAERTELGVVQRTHDLHLGTIKTVLFAVVHPAGEDLFRSCGKVAFDPS